MKECKYCHIELKRKSWAGKRLYKEPIKRFNERQYCDNICRSKQLFIDSKGEKNYFYGKHLKPWNYKRMSNENIVEKRLYNAKGKKGFLKGNPGKPMGAVSYETKFKRRIFEILEERDKEVKRAKIEDLMRLGGSFVPKDDKDVEQKERVVVVINNARENNRTPFYPTSKSANDKR